MRIDGRMRVDLEINSGNNPSGHRKTVAADWISINANRRFDRRNAPETERFRIFEKTLIADTQNGQVAIMSDELHRGWVMLRVVLLFDDYKSRIADHVCVRKDPIAVDHKASSNASRHCTGVPRHFVIRIL